MLLKYKLALDFKQAIEVVIIFEGQVKKYYHVVL